MIDFHSHILPGVDDGSKNTDESLTLLRMLSEQGVDTVVATSHYLPDFESVDSFITRRQNSYDKLSAALFDGAPDIMLGAEVKYYEGISHLSGLSDLCIEDSNLLLLEMPMGKWSEYSIKELINMAGSKDFTIVLAHIERYLKYQNIEILRRLLEYGILLQVNASFFNDLLSRRKAFAMLSGGAIHFIGSDCHNVSHRPPRIGRAYDLINKKLGEEFLSDFTECQRALLFK